MTATILITGATSGIGLSTAEHLRNLGYQVLITGRSAEKLAEAKAYLGDSVSAYLADTSSLPAIQQLAQEIEQQHGQLDGVFINAGIYQRTPINDTSEQLFDEIMNINLKGAYFTIQYLLPLLKKPSSIVLNTSLVVERAFAGTAVYTASKAALDGLAKVLTVELAPRGIRVNSVRPSVTATPIQGKAGMTDQETQQLFGYVAQTSPLGRVLTPQDIAQTVEFLLSPRSEALQGQSLTVSGGFSL